MQKAVLAGLAAASLWTVAYVEWPAIAAEGTRRAEYRDGRPAARYRLALFYDGNAEANLPRGVKSHMDRDIGLAWLTQIEYAFKWLPCQSFARCLPSC
jgi:hypothetical protein